MMEDSYVYFIQAQQPGGGGPIKIGVSVKPVSRLAALFCWSPYPLVILATAPGGRWEEREIHKKFKDQRLNGEWFTPSKDMMEMIDRVNVSGRLDREMPRFRMPECPKGHRMFTMLGDVLRQRKVSVATLAQWAEVCDGTVRQWLGSLPEDRAAHVTEIFAERGITIMPDDLFVVLPWKVGMPLVSTREDIKRLYPDHGS